MTDEDVWSAVTIWVQLRPMHDLQMLSLLCYEIGMRDVGLNIGDSSKLAAQIVGRSARTVNEWRRNFIENEGEFPPDMRGKYARVSIMTHEDCRVRAAKWARAHACVRGEPNMTVTDFAYYINNTLLPSMHLPPGFPTTICTLLSFAYDRHIFAYDRVRLGGISVRSTLITHRYSYKNIRGRKRLEQLIGPYVTDNSACDWAALHSAGCRLA